MRGFSLYSALYNMCWHVTAQCSLPHDPCDTLASQAPQTNPHAVLLSAGSVDRRTVGCTTRTAPSKFWNDQDHAPSYLVEVRSFSALVSSYVYDHLVPPPIIEAYCNTKKIDGYWDEADKVCRSTRSCVCNKIVWQQWTRWSYLDTVCSEQFSWNVNVCIHVSEIQWIPQSEPNILIGLSLVCSN